MLLGTTRVSLPNGISFRPTVLRGARVWRTDSVWKTYRHTDTQTDYALTFILIFIINGRRSQYQLLGIFCSLLHWCYSSSLDENQINFLQFSRHLATMFICPTRLTPGHAEVLIFDLLTPKPNRFISVPRCTTDKSLVKIHQRIPEILQKQHSGRRDGLHENTTCPVPPNSGGCIKISVY